MKSDLETRENKGLDLLHILLLPFDNIMLAPDMSFVNDLEVDVHLFPMLESKRGERKARIGFYVKVQCAL